MTTAFLLTSLVIVVTPGTGALLTISAGLARGARASLLTAFGCTLGVVPHLMAAATGAAAVLHASGVAFEAIKFAGVLYLLWMAVATWRDRSELVVDDGDGDARGPDGTRMQGTAGEGAAGRRLRTGPSVRSVLATSILANLLNPKLTIFFFAFLPQFVSEGSSSPVGQMLALSSVFMLMTFVVFALYGMLAAAMRDHVIRRPRVVRRMRQAFSVSFVALSARLATEQR